MTDLIDANDNKIISTIENESNNAKLLSLMEVAVNSESGIEKLEKLMHLYESFENNEAKKSFYSAMAKFQGVLPIIKKKGLASFEHKHGNGKTEYTFAKLEDIAEGIRPALSCSLLSYRYEQKTEGHGINMLITVTCIVSHVDGYQQSMSMSSYPDQSGKKNQIQQLASTVSYLRRYTLTGVLGITVAEEDNDAISSKEENNFNFISKEQKFKLSELIEKSGMSINEFCNNKVVNINSLEELPKLRFTGAINWINRKIGDKNANN